MALYSESPEVEEDELLEMFLVFDPDNKGRIDKEQFVEVMQRLGEDLSEEQLNQLVYLADDKKYRDGKIDYSDFVKYIMNVKSEG